MDSYSCQILPPKKLNYGLQGDTRMTDDEILTSVLGQRSGYIRGKGYGAEPSRKRNRSQSSQTSLNHVRIQMQQYFDRKIQEERKKFEANLAAERAKMKEERATEQANLEEERATKRARIEEEQAQFEQRMEQKMQAHFAVLMKKMQANAHTSAPLSSAH